MAGEDPQYVQWIREQPCCACESPFGVQAHHHTGGTTAPVFPKDGEPLASNERPRGKSERAHDTWCIPLCIKCHANLHGFHGLFSPFDQKQRRAWQDEWVRHFRERWLDKETF